MKLKRIIPCLDIHGGRVVKGSNFINLRDAGDPVELAAFYEKEGADELVFLDISATVEERKTTVGLVKRVAAQLSIPFIVGGGIRTLDDIAHILEAGADKVSINSAAIKDPQLIELGADRFGRQAIVVAIDAKQSEENFWEVYTDGGKLATGLDARAWARETESLGAGEILLTSMDRDGSKGGYDVALTRAVSEQVKIPLIASGGAGKLEHLYEAISLGQADAVLCASIFHFREYTVRQAKEYLANKGVLVQL